MKIIDIDNSILSNVFEKYFLEQKFDHMDLHSGGLNTENSIAFTEVQIVRLRNVQTMYYIRLFQTMPFDVL